MRELLGRALAALKSLKPQLQNDGAGSVQVGKTGGSVKVVNVNQTAAADSKAGLLVGHVHGQVTHHHVQVHQHFYPERATAPPPVAPSGQGLQDPTRGRPPLSASHREVLALLDGLPQRITVLDFMEREFSTRMVIDLSEPQLYRTRRYVETIKRASAAQHRARPKSHQVLWPRRKGDHAGNAQGGR